MLSRLFLISTLLLVGITTVARGVPAAEIIEGIKAVKFPQMESGNLTLNRRFIKGVPGLPQCPDANHPDLVSSFCLNAKTITALCGDSKNPQDPAGFITPCPNKTVCMDFKTAPTPP
ncbi:hypothetical protein Glove_259g14 [Diversispora epigaea]|uniref:Uncharacterized protein n=1 Tax=Diversispora epigaea TaxID=1348612 RepID=A0A397IE17_9GLOM|nr:hypothetical protein Glove_259g14 [Diversispora epigaea]